MFRIFLPPQMLAVLLLLIPFLFYNATGFATSPGTKPMDQLQESVDKILEILQAKELRVPEKEDERRQRILEVVDTMFNFREMARSSMGRHWHTITAEQQEKFVGLFKDLVEERYIGKIDSYDNQKVVYKKQLVKGDRALIYTDIVDKDLEIPIVYRLEESNGKWLINDLKIENVSLIVNYRRDFDSIIRREQFEGLVEKITEQLEKSKMSN